MTCIGSEKALLILKLAEMIDVDSLYHNFKIYSKKYLISLSFQFKNKHF